MKCEAITSCSILPSINIVRNGVNTFRSRPTPLSEATEVPGEDNNMHAVEATRLQARTMLQRLRLLRPDRVRVRQRQCFFASDPLFLFPRQRPLVLSYQCMFAGVSRDHCVHFTQVQICLN